MKEDDLKDKEREEENRVFRYVLLKKGYKIRSCRLSISCILHILTYGASNMEQKLTEE